MATQPERIAALEERTRDVLPRIKALERLQKPVEESHALRNIIIGVLLTAFLSWGAYITIAVVALKQSVADGGTHQLVSQLESPQSKIQLRANLTSVIAAVETARAAGKPISTKKVAEVSDAVSVVLKRDDSSPEAWEAAGDLVSYRTATYAKIAPNECMAGGAQVIMYPVTNVDQMRNFRSTMALAYHDCTITLDDFDARQLGDFGGPMRGLVLTNVHVIYRGGAITRVSAITFVNCSFDIQLTVPPPSTGKKITTMLLAAKDITQVQADLIQPS